MIEQPFSLIPFLAPNIPEVIISGSISRHENVLALHYILAGKTSEIFLPPLSTSPSRKDELWQTTCFEFFLAIKDRPQYWEFNMSPSGDWNIYRMDAYRRIGFREETSIQQFQFAGREQRDTFALDTAIDLTPILHMDQDMEIGITAVIQTRNGAETYWALAHPALQADFHRRESFTLALAGQSHL